MLEYQLGIPPHARSNIVHWLICWESVLCMLLSENEKIHFVGNDFQTMQLVALVVVVVVVVVILYNFISDRIQQWYRNRKHFVNAAFCLWSQGKPKGSSSWQRSLDKSYPLCSFRVAQALVGLAVRWFRNLWFIFFFFAISRCFLSVSEISCFRTLVSSWGWMALHSSRTWVCVSSPSPHALQRMLFYLLLILFFTFSILVLALNIILALYLGSPFMYRTLFSRFPSDKTFQ